MIVIYYFSEKWLGFLNLNLEDINLFIIFLFGGMGKDGNGDKKVD